MEPLGGHLCSHASDPFGLHGAQNNQLGVSLCGPHTLLQPQTDSSPRSTQGWVGEASCWADPECIHLLIGACRWVESAPACVSCRHIPMRHTCVGVYPLPE